MTTDTVPCISLQDFAARREEITRQLMDASTHVGFFTLKDHGIPQAEVDEAFAYSRHFFALAEEVKAKTPLNGRNMGWESRAQVRPSTGTADMKESMQLQFARMQGMWPAEEDLPQFRRKMEHFMAQVQQLSVQVMECFADGLGLPRDTFTEGTVETGKQDSQSTLRLLHYHDTKGKDFGPTFWRAGAHADFDVLTMLFQRDGEGGLEVCPGRKVVGDFGMGNTWTPVEARSDRIVCNIGDQLMRWSDDRLKSTYHRVGMPKAHQAWAQGPRYSMAFFNQARSDVVIQGPEKKYPPITGAEFIQQALARNALANAEAAAKASSAKRASLDVPVVASAAAPSIAAPPSALMAA